MIKPTYNELLKEWFLKNKRSFPWRQNPTPYKVWISEMMLQQTRADVVVPYFERWMTLFPEISFIEKAPLKVLMKAWEGLGYYQRLRNIQKAAKEIRTRFNGTIPHNEEELATLPGIGPYTRGAILSFAFQKRAAAIDANSLRAMARYFQIEEELSNENAKKKLFMMQEKLLPTKEPHLIVEAWIELGALICQKKPYCERCPLLKSCCAYQNHRVFALPLLRKKKKVITLHRVVLAIEREGKWLLRQVPSGEVMADLWEFPYFDCRRNTITKKKVQSWADSFLGIIVEELFPLDLQKQSFTSFNVTLVPFVAEARKVKGKKNSYLWIDNKEVEELSFSSGHRRILDRLKG